MIKYKILILVSFISILLLFLNVPFFFPIEGFIFWGFISLLWATSQIYNHKEFSISKGFIFAFIFAIYTVILIPHSYPVPANLLTVYKIFEFLWLSIMCYVSLRNENDRTVWENSLILVGILVSLFEISEIVIWYSNYRSIIPNIHEIDLEKSYRLSGFLFLHPNILAGYVNFVWPIIFIRIFNSSRKRVIYLLVACLLLFATILFFSGSRGGLLGAISGLIFLLYRLILSVKAQKTFKPIFNYKIRGLGWITIIILVIMILTAYSFFWREKQIGQFIFSMLNSNDFPAFINIISSGRAEIFKYSLEAYLEHPFVGHGNASFPIAYLKEAQLPPGFFAPSAHNLLLNTAVEYGLLGLGFLIFVLVTFFMKTIAYYKNKFNSDLYFTDAYLTAMVAFLVQHIFDSMLWATNYLGAFLIVLVLMVRYISPFEEWKLGRSSYLRLNVFFIIIVSLLIISLSKEIAPNQIYSDLTYTKEIGIIKNKFCHLANKFPTNALYRFQCSISILQEKKIPNVSNMDIETIRESLQNQKIGFSRNPYWPPQEANLAVLYWFNGEKEIALKHMRNAAKSAPKNQQLWLNLGFMEEQAGNQEESLLAYERVLRLNPLLSKSIFQHSSKVFPDAKVLLGSWMVSEYLWDDWYESEVIDKDFWRGVIALSLDQVDLATRSFEKSASLYPPTLNYYVYSAYSKKISGQDELAFKITKEIADFDQQNIFTLEDPILLSLVGSMLRENGENDLAYSMFMKSYKNQNRISEDLYYSTLYGQHLLIKETSPFIISSYIILDETRSDWLWFINEVFRKEDISLAQEINFWNDQSIGLWNYLEEYK